MESEKELKKKGIEFELITLNQAVHSVHDVQLVCMCTALEVIKTLVFVGHNPIIVIMTGGKRVNITKLEEYIGESGLRLASSEEVLTITGYNVGSVSPFAINTDIRQIADISILSLPSLFLGSGKNDVLIKLKQSQFVKSFRGNFASVSD